MKWGDSPRTCLRPLGGYQPLGPELLELLEGLGEVLQEPGLVLGVHLDPLDEGGVLDEDQVSGEHHEPPGGGVDVLGRPLPLLGDPVQGEEEGEVEVVEGGRGGGPGAAESRGGLVAPPQGVGAAEADDLLIVEAHPVEDGAEVVAVGLVGLGGAVGGGGEAAVGGDEGLRLVGPAGAPSDHGPSRLLDGGDCGEEVRRDNR